MNSRLAGHQIYHGFDIDTEVCQNPVNWIDPLRLFNISRNGFEGVAGTRSNEIISETLEGMNRPVRQPNASFTSNQTVADVLKSDRFKEMAKLAGLDCSKIAKKLLDVVGGKDKIIEVHPLKKGMLNVFENKHIKGGRYYHQVYTDGKYTYDPRLFSYPIPKGNREKHIKAIITDGVIISNIIA